MVNAPGKVFHTLRNMAEFKYLFSYPNEERIYEERCRKYYSQELMRFKKRRKTWKEFYLSLRLAIYDPVDRFLGGIWNRENKFFCS